MIVALIPAHNEESGIAQTILSFQNQTVPPDYIIVVADNCTDATAEVAESFGAWVFHTKDNTDKKAGALNQALDFIVPHMERWDFIVPADADSVLCENWIETALSRLDDTMGAVSGAYVARKGKGFITLLQRAEYVQERRRISRRGGHVDVLSGTAVMFPVRVLKALYSSRGYIYDVNSLTEDFEVTLALKKLGYQPRCFKELKVVTDVMETWGDLYRQRLRWQRGTIETLQTYGWNNLTKRLWTTNILTYLSSFVAPVVAMSWVVTLYMGLGFSLMWLAVLPIFMLEQAVSSRKGGLGPMVVSASLIPMWTYDVFRTTVYWIALGKSLRRTKATWN